VKREDFEFEESQKFPVGILLNMIKIKKGRGKSV